jgi:hypothetical protein
MASAHAQAAHAAAQQAHLQAQVHQVHHQPSPLHAQPHKQHEITTEEKLQEKGEAVILYARIVPQISLSPRLPSSIQFMIY